MTTTIKKGRLDVSARGIHLLLVIFGLAAWLTGDGAGDYKKADYFDFTIHKWLGMALAAALLTRILYGLIGPSDLRFSKWLPYTEERLKLAGQALLSAALYRAPNRSAHLAFAGLIQGLGIALFLWMAATGSIIFLFLEPGSRARGLMHFIMEIHEVGEGLIPLYLAVHLGAVAIHALYGLDLWRKMFFMKKRGGLAMNTKNAGPRL